jgi:hypothetical protein
MKTEDAIVTKALVFAQTLGVEIVRGPLFDWRWKGDLRQLAKKYPSKCNAVGALLLYYELAQPGFKPGWIDELCEVSGIKPPWLWRFIHGWDYGNELTITYTDKDGKHEATEKDKVSRYANKLAKKWTAIR